ncbi:MAG: hypothetical protein FWD68_05370 [Alphaproteobacteria bacterium]|nr:hypothetical protein [Alphaproteobacteria bacterium]
MAIGASIAARAASRGEEGFRVAVDVEGATFEEMHMMTRDPIFAAISAVNNLRDRAAETQLRAAAQQ